MEKYESQTENTETNLNKYIYRDGSKGKQVIFECMAKDITEADKLYEEKTGKNPEKQNSVECSIEFAKKKNE